VTTTNNGINVDVTWAATPDDHGSAVTSYLLKFLKADGTWLENTANCSGSNSVIFAARKCTIPMSVFRTTYGLGIDAIIACTITATNGKGTSTISTANTAGAKVQNVPQVAPVLSRGAGTDVTKIQVNWTSLTLSTQTGGAAISGYVIEWDSSGSFTTLTTLTNGSQVTYFTAQTLVQGKAYKFRITPKNIYGDGPVSAELSITPAAVPNAPTALTIMESSVTKIKFQWTAPYDGGLSIDTYNVFWDQGTGSGTFVPTSPASTGSGTIKYFEITTGLNAGSSYKFKVAAKNAIGQGALSAQATFIAASRPGAPLNLQKVSASASAITISWLAPAVANNGGSPISTYKVYMNNVLVSASTNGATTYTQSTGLTAGQQYSFEVSAVNGFTEGDKTSPLLVYAATVTSVPLNVRKKTASTSSITIEWDAPTNTGNSPITDYRVSWDTGAQNNVYVVAASSVGGPNTRTYSIGSGLSAGTLYSFKVQAINAVGLSSYSNVAAVVAALLPSKVAPAPTKHSASTTEIEIRWTAPSNGGSSISDYKVYWDSGLGNTFTQLGTSSGYLAFKALTSNGLVAGNTY